MGPCIPGDKQVYVAYRQDKVYKDIGDTPQLFIDDDIVAVVKNITRRQHWPVKDSANPLIRRDKPWEVTTYFRVSNFNVIRDPQDQIFRCWYEDFYEYFDPGLPSRERMYYAQSRDGLNWDKPILGKHVIDGHDTNAIFVPEDAMVDCPSILLDPSESNPDYRFKMTHLNLDRRDKSGAPGGLHLQYSANGIDWTPHKNNPVIPSWQGDVGILTYDNIDRKYVLWGRLGGAAGGSAHPDMDNWFSPVWPGRPEGIWGTRRRVYRTESKDLFNWSDPELLWDPKEDFNLDDGLYGFVPWRVGDMHLGLLNVVHAVDNTMDMYLYYSRDGLQWKQFLDHRPFISRGGQGSYDQFGVETPVQPFVFDNEIRFYYGGMKVHHDWWILPADQRPDVPEAHDWEMAKNGHHLCLASLRLDGYISLDATVREGWVDTKPLFSTGKHLHINAQCGPGGYVQVEMMDHWNNVWPEYAKDKCQTFTGDSTRHHVRWSDRQTVDAIPKPLKLRFTLKNASLYSFGFADS